MKRYWQFKLSIYSHFEKQNAQFMLNHKDF